MTPLSKTEDEIFRFLTRKEFNERLMMDRREKASDKQKKTVREVMKELFKASSASDDDDALMQSFMNCAGSFKNRLEKLEIHYQNQPKYPGRQVVQRGRTLMLNTLDIRFSTEFFRTVDSRRDDFFDLAEDFEPVSAFFGGEQRKFFDKSLDLMRIYDDSKTFVADTELEQIVRQIKDILRMPSPYREIYKLPELNQRFINCYYAILMNLMGPVKESIADARARVFEELNAQNCKQAFEQRVHDRFLELKDKAEHCNNAAALQNIRIEADTLKVRFLNEIAAYVAKRDTPPAPADKDDTPPVTPPKPVKKRKTVSIKSVTTSSTWQIETTADVDKYLAALRAKLNAILEENTVINIEF